MLPALIGFVQLALLRQEGLEPPPDLVAQVLSIEFERVARAQVGGCVAPSLWIPEGEACGCAGAHNPATLRRREKVVDHPPIHPELRQLEREARRRRRGVEQPRGGSQRCQLLLSHKELVARGHRGEGGAFACAPS
eukprot:scaffold77606_cov31-Tisochrysis_lutea.AAC.1